MTHHIPLINRYGFTAAKETFQDDYNPNVIATLVGEVEPDTIVVVGAHYDSRGVQRSSATAGEEANFGSISRGLTWSAPTPP